MALPYFCNARDLAQKIFDDLSKFRSKEEENPWFISSGLNSINLIHSDENLSQPVHLKIKVLSDSIHFYLQHQSRDKIGNKNSFSLKLTAILFAQFLNKNYPQFNPHISILHL